MQNGIINTMRLFDGLAIGQNQSALSVLIDLRHISGKPLFSIHSILVGDGTLKLQYLLTADPSLSPLTPDNAVDIVSGQVGGTSGYYGFDPELGPFLQIKATENNVNSILSLDLWINLQ